MARRTGTKAESVKVEKDGVQKAPCAEKNSRALTTTRQDNSPEALLSKAIAQNLPMESLEKLMAMRREILVEQAKAAFFDALAGFQGDCPPIVKNRSVQEKDSSSIRYKYATIDAIIEQTREARSRWGLSHKIETEQTDTSVTSICRVYHSQGWSEETRFTVPIDPKAYMSAPQKVASALSFSKRYALCNAYGIVTVDEDDDAHSVGFTVMEDGNTEDAVIARTPAGAPPGDMSIGEIYEKTERELLKLTPERGAALRATALRLRDGGNVGAMKALYESAIRMVSAETKKE